VRADNFIQVAQHVSEVEATAAGGADEVTGARINKFRLLALSGDHWLAAQYCSYVALNVIGKTTRTRG
jgi:hypothetical protein